MVQFDAEFNFLENGTTQTLCDALTPLPWPHFVFNFGYGANYFWSQLSTLPLLVLIQVLVLLYLLMSCYCFPMPLITYVLRPSASIQSKHPLRFEQVKLFRQGVPQP
jgi:hypothetical protein